jgi:hypothetical protein
MSDQQQPAPVDHWTIGRIHVTATHLQPARAVAIDVGTPGEGQFAIYISDEQALALAEALKASVVAYRMRCEAKGQSDAAAAVGVDQSPISVRDLVASWGRLTAQGDWALARKYSTDADRAWLDGFNAARRATLGGALAGDA